METKWSKCFLIILISCLSACGNSQVENYTIISSDSLKIASFKFGESMQSFLNQFGEPTNYKEYSDPYPADGYGKSFYIDYDSLKATFIEYYKNVILSNISITGSNYLTEIGNFSSIKVGVPLEKLKQFQKSYEFFLKQNKKPYKEREQYFYVNILIKNSGDQYYGLLNIKLINDKVVEIVFRFDEGT